MIKEIKPGALILPRDVRRGDKITVRTVRRNGTVRIVTGVVDGLPPRTGVGIIDDTGFYLLPPVDSLTSPQNATITLEDRPVPEPVEPTEPGSFLTVRYRGATDLQCAMKFNDTTWIVMVFGEPEGITWEELKCSYEIISD